MGGSILGRSSVIEAKDGKEADLSSVIVICRCWAGALELQCQYQAPDRMSHVCVYCGVVRVKFAAEKRFSSLVFIASLQVCNTLFDP
jgi:hypothetical protein